ncbi:MAG: glycosyltransferase [Polyangiales bacterium]
MIPNVAHFIWYGRTLPWLHAMSIVSAARKGRFEHLVLHHADELDAASRDRLAALTPPSQPALELRKIAPAQVFGRDARGRRLRALHSELTQPAARANMLRAALLEAEGGVYLDMDTVTLQSFQPLMAAEAFCGVEPVAFPAALRQRPSIGGYARAYALAGLRTWLRREPRGPRYFPHVAHLFTMAVNNAIVGARAGHPLLAQVLDRMLVLPADVQRRRYALGTHLLQTVLEESDSKGLVVHPQPVFYPLGPQLSEHWFRVKSQLRLSDVIGPETFAVHWYASVRTRHWVDRIDPSFVRQHTRDQLISGLLASYA